jgi:16S rRNA (guanine(966)-N(2))-methyltransferase RsmD
MRITGGELAGRALRVPRRAVRPTADRVRESLFSMLAHRGALTGARVLDLFAGSGALGIEALSRGAREAVFVESSREVVRTLEENLAALGLAGRARVVPRAAEPALRALAAAGERFELCFLDPPYAEALGAKLLRAIAESGLAPAGAVLVAETDRRHAPGPLPGLDLQLERRYGDTLITLYLVAPRAPEGGLAEPGENDR